MLATSFKSESANGSSSSAISRPRPAAYSPSVRTCLTAGRPLLGRRNHFLLPDVFAQDQQHVLRLEQVGHVEIRPDPLDVEPLDAGVEVDQPDRDAGDAHDRQAGRVALVLDQPLLLDVDVERIGEDVDRVEADLLGLVDAERRPAAGLDPGGVDESEFHGDSIVPVIDPTAFDDGPSGRLAAAIGPRFCVGRARPARRTVKHDPSPGVDWTSIVPSCSWTIP